MPAGAFARRAKPVQCRGQNQLNAAGKAKPNAAGKDKPNAAGKAKPNAAGKISPMRRANAARRGGQSQSNAQQAKP